MPDVAGSDRNGSSTPASRALKSGAALTILSLVGVVLMTVHLSQDIVFGYDRAGANNLSGIAMLAVWLFATLALSGRRSGYLILILGSLLAAIMPVIHMGVADVRAEVVKSSGGLLFLWTLLALGVSGSVSFVLSIEGLWRLERKIWRVALLSVVTIAAGAALLAWLASIRS